MLLDIIYIVQPNVSGSYSRQITEKELKISAKQINLQRGLIELLIEKVRENQKRSVNNYR